jgi:hypothetical protein
MKQVCPKAQTMNREMRHAARQKAALAIAGTAGGADPRPRRKIETIQAGKMVEVIEGHDPLDGLNLSPRQSNAAAYLRDLWRDALPAYEQPSGYGTGAGHGGQRHLSHDEYLAAGRAWHDYKRAMTELTRRGGHTIAAAVRSMVIDGDPAFGGHVRDGLEILGIYWKYA